MFEIEAVVFFMNAFPKNYFPMNGFPKIMDL
jgi:hypothetical protein